MATATQGRIASRLCLSRHRTPQGSSTAEPQSAEHLRRLRRFVRAGHLPGRERLITRLTNDRAD